MQTTHKTRPMFMVGDWRLLKEPGQPPPRLRSQAEAQHLPRVRRQLLERFTSLVEATLKLTAQALKLSPLRRMFVAVV